jgi:hypothetical protein
MSWRMLSIMRRLCTGLLFTKNFRNRSRQKTAQPRSLLALAATAAAFVVDFYVAPNGSVRGWSIAFQTGVVYCLQVFCPRTGGSRLLLPVRRETWSYRAGGCQARKQFNRLARCVLVLSASLINPPQQTLPSNYSPASDSEQMERVQFLIIAPPRYHSKWEGTEV